MAVVLALAGGCLKKMTKDEWVQTTTRTIQAVTKEQALAAAEQILMLSDGDDFEIYPDDTGFRANRKWGCYMVIAAASGVDYWTVKAREVPEGVQMHVEVSIAESASSAMPTVSMSHHGGGNWYVAGSSTPGMQVVGNATYELFWRRLDYMLGKSTDWIVCDRAIAMQREGELWGRNALCDQCNVDDKAPTELRGKTLYEPKKDIMR